MKNKIKTTNLEDSGYLFNYIELYRAALFGMQVCLHGLNGKVQSYNSAVCAKDVERVRKIARDIEVLDQSQRHFFRALGIQSRYILINTTQDNCCAILTCITEEKGIDNPEKGIRVIDSALSKCPGLIKKIGIGGMDTWLLDLKKNPRMCLEYILLVQAASLAKLNKNYEEVVDNYGEVSEKLISAFYKAYEVLGKLEGLLPREYASEISRDDAGEKSMDDALHKYIRENLDPYTHKAYR